MEGEAALKRASRATEAYVGGPAWLLAAGGAVSPEDGADAAYSAAACLLGADEAGAEDLIGRRHVRRQQPQQTSGGVAQRRVLQVRAEVGKVAQEQLDLRGTPQRLFHCICLSK